MIIGNLFTLPDNWENCWKIQNSIDYSWAYSHTKFAQVDLNLKSFFANTQILISHSICELIELIYVDIKISIIFYGTYDNIV